MSQSLNNDYMFYNTTSLDNAQLSGVKSTIRFYNCFLGSGAITDIFNNLETVSNQTVDVRLNYGTSKLHSDTIAIATNKGWTVTT
jgi:hypothetical protein